MIFSSDFISLYKSIFYGRQDIHAIRWDKDGKTGYMPAYKVDWNDFNKYKSGGEPSRIMPIKNIYHFLMR